MRTLIWGGLALPTADGPPQTRFAVLVHGTTIEQAGSYDGLRAMHPEVPVIGGDHLLLLPALANAHDHGRGIGSALLGVPDDLLEIWLPGLWAQPNLDPYTCALRDGLRMLHSGCTSVAHSHNPRGWDTMGAEAEATLRGYADAGVRVGFHLPYIDQNPLLYAERERFLAGLPPSVQALAQPFLAPVPLTQADYLQLCTTLFDRYHDADGHTVHIQVSPAGGQWCSDELIAACIAWAQPRNTRVQMHMLETFYQMRYAHRTWDATFLQHLAQTGALGPWLTLAHLVWPDLDDLPMLAERGVAVAHNPSSNLRLRSGIAPIAEIASAGVRLGVGLDGHTLDEDQDMLRELRLAWTLANRPGAEAPSVAARDIWHIGTAGGAATIFGPTVPLGTLAPGQHADVVLADLSTLVWDWRLEGELLRGALLRMLSAQHVQHVMVAGHWHIRDGRHTSQDQSAVHAELRAQLTASPPASQHPNGLAAQALSGYLRRFYQSWNQ